MQAIGASELKMARQLISAAVQALRGTGIGRNLAPSAS
jgi:hypothetical protein